MQTKLIKISLMTLVLSALLYPTFALNLGSNQIQAEEEVKEPEFPMEPSMTGRIEGTGTDFEIKDSEYLNITLKSSEEIKVVLESIPRMISLDVSSSSESTSTNLTIRGLEPNKTYYQYQDSYKNEAVFVSDGNESYSWSQDLTQPHHIWLQEIKGTTFIDKDTILDHDITGSVEITANNITLDCNGHKITGPHYGGFGIYLNHKTGVAIKNCTVSDFSYGVYFYSSSDSNLIDNIILNSLYGVKLNFSAYNSLLNNTTSNNVYAGIYLFSSFENILENNTISSNQQQGIFLFGGLTYHNIVSENMVSGNPTGILAFFSYMKIP